MLLLAVVAALACIAVVVAVEVLFPRGTTPRAVPSPPVREVKPEAGQPAPAPPPPRTPDKTVSLRQTLNEIFDGRDRGHSVTAAVERGAVRIRSSRPGYVYVLAASTSQTDGAVQFVAMLFPRAGDTNNRIRPGQSLQVPDLQWPPNAEFLAIVSDEPREIDVLGPLAGTVICPGMTPCSESYGAVVLSAARPRDTTSSPAAPKAAAPAARPTSPGPRRCSDILERASLGEVLTAEEFTFLRRECR
ncbi:MAG: hypothetical protein ACRELZ_21455 [Candidatus Rokuibacteriota bacterium]